MSQLIRGLMLLLAVSICSADSVRAYTNMPTSGVTGPAFASEIDKRFTGVVHINPTNDWTGLTIYTAAGTSAPSCAGVLDGAYITVGDQTGSCSGTYTSGGSLRCFARCDVPSGWNIVGGAIPGNTLPANSFATGINSSGTLSGRRPSTADLSDAPTLGSPGGSSSLVNPAWHAAPTAAGTSNLTCKGTSGNYPFTDVYSGALAGNNVTYSLPASGCADFSIILEIIQQDAAHTVTNVTTASGGITGTQSWALGAVAGNLLIQEYMWYAPLSTWVALSVGTYPVQAYPVGSGGTGQLILGSHSLLAGAGAAPIAQIGPSATSGQPLLAKGSSADPAYGPLNLAGGASIVTGLLPFANVGSGNAPIQILFQENPAYTQAAAQNTVYNLIQSNTGYTVAGGTLGTNHSIDVFLHGAYVNPNATTDNPTFSASYGGTTMATGTLSQNLSQTSTGTEHPFWIRCHLAAVGSASAQQGSCTIWINGNVNSTSGAWGSASSNMMGENISMAVASGSNQPLAINYNDTASANSTIKTYSDIVTLQ